MRLGSLAPLQSHNYALAKPMDHLKPSSPTPLYHQCHSPVPLGQSASSPAQHTAYNCFWPHDVKTYTALDRCQLTQPPTPQPDTTFYILQQDVLSDCLPFFHDQGPPTVHLWSLLVPEGPQWARRSTSCNNQWRQVPPVGKGMRVYQRSPQCTSSQGPWSDSHHT